MKKVLMIVCRSNPGMKKFLVIMRLTLFLTILTTLGVTAGNSYAQSTKLNFSFKNKEIKFILNEIENSSEFFFMYNNKDVDVTQKVDIEAKSKTVQEVLDLMFKETNITYTVRDRHIMIYPEERESKVQDQQKSVSGKVTDEKGEPLPGVTVLIKGTTNGTITNFNGEYNLSGIEVESVLQFSFVGMRTQEIVVGNQTTMNVTLLADAISIDEVVAIGYGVQKKSDLTGSVGSISTEELGDRQASSVADLMQGRVPGLDVTRNKIRIRGVTTLNNTDPLIVIDGFIGGDLSIINPDDIQNIEVLKDASSTAIYGSRGANGVILVTTKSGKDSKLLLSVNAFSGIKATPKKIDVLTASEYIDYVNDALNNAGQPITDKLMSNAVRQDVTNWQDEIFQIGNLSEVNVSLSGGSDKFSQYTSLGYRFDENIVIGPSSQSIFLQNKSEFKLNKNIKLRANTFLKYDIDKGNMPLVGSAIQFPQYHAIYDENNVGGYSDSDRIEDASDAVNPIPYATNIHPETNTLRYQTQLKLDMQLFKGLTYTLQAGVRGSFSRYFKWIDEFQAAGTVKENTSLEEKSSYMISPIVESYFTYVKEIDMHNITALIGNSWENGIRSGGIGISANGFNSNEIKYIGAATNLAPPTQNIVKDARLAYFGRLNYAYRSKYLLTVNVRRDASPNFAPNNRWGTFPSVSVAWKIFQESFMKDQTTFSNLKLRMGWGVSGNDAIGQYKYQSAIARQGIGYPLGVTQSFAQGATVKQNYSPNIKWESTESKTIGVDFGLFDNSLTGTIEYYDKKTKDILFAIPRPWSLGYGTQKTGGDAVENAATVQNRGVEIQLGKKGKLKSVNYNIMANYTYGKNEVVSLGLGQPFISGVSRTDSGHPIGYFYGYVADGLFLTQAEIDAFNADAKKNGFDYYQEASTSAGDVKFKDINGDGRITGEDRTEIGSPIPKHMFGLNLSLNYKNFDFNMYMQGQANVDLYYGGYAWSRAGVRLLNQESAVLDRWRSESVPGNGIQPRAISGDPVGNTRPSSLIVEDASYLRMKLISLGYSFPQQMLSRLNISRLRLYVSSENLFTITGYHGFDPEIGGDNLTRGVAGYELPLPRTAVLGIQVAF